MKIDGHNFDNVKVIKYILGFIAYPIWWLCLLCMAPVYLPFLLLVCENTKEYKEHIHFLLHPLEGLK